MLKTDEQSLPFADRDTETQPGRWHEMASDAVGCAYRHPKYHETIKRVSHRKVHFSYPKFDLGGFPRAPRTQMRQTFFCLIPPDSFARPV
jgi:hypothetical protein